MDYTLAAEKRLAYRAIARESILEFLQDNVKNDYPKGDDELAYQAWKAVDVLLDTRDELERRMASAEREFDACRKFINGQPGICNSLGILQGNGPRIDQLVALFHERVNSAVDALYRLNISLPL